MKITASHIINCNKVSSAPGAPCKRHAVVSKSLAVRYHCLVQLCASLHISSTQVLLQGTTYAALQHFLYPYDKKYITMRSRN